MKNKQWVILGNGGCNEFHGNFIGINHELE
jgi:heat shock protein HslJ